MSNNKKPVSNKKLIIIFFLILIANTEWIFIGLNYDVFAKLQEIEKQDNVNLQKEFLEDIEKGVPVHLEEKEIKYEDFFWFKPYKLNIPSINVESPVYNTNRNIEMLLDKWVVNFNENKKASYIFGHSSSKVETPYSYIFTKITKLDDWDIISLEGRDTIKLYKYKDYYYKKSDELSELEDMEEKVYLITCYPFNTSITRYVAEFEFFKEISK